VGILPGPTVSKWLMILEVGHHRKTVVGFASQNRPPHRKMEELKMMMNQPKNRRAARLVNPAKLSRPY